MANVELSLLAAIGEHVLLRAEAFTGQAALVMAW